MQKQNSRPLVTKGALREQVQKLLQRKKESPELRELSAKFSAVPKHFKPDNEQWQQRENSSFKFYRTKWTQILLKNFSSLCEGKGDKIIYSWSSLYNFLYLSRDQLPYAPVSSKLQQQVRFFLLSEGTEARQKAVLKLLDKNQVQDLQLQYQAAQGLTPGSRAALYLQLFSSALEDREYQQLVEEAREEQGPLASLLEDDVLAVCQNEQYFVFQQDMLLLLKVLMRDKTLLQNLEARPFTLQERTVFCSGVIPCRGFAILLAPFFYLSQDTEMVYLLFREFYSSHLVKLHCISGQPSSIGHLLALFRKEGLTKLRKLFERATQLEVKLEKHAFQWMFSCFIGFIDVQEVLLVLDFIVGNNSLQILVALAVGALALQEKSLLLAVTKEEFLALMGISHLQVRQILQKYVELLI